MANGSRGKSDPPFAAFAFKNDSTGQVIIAYRGTDGLKDLTADAAIFAGRWDPQFQKALDFAQAVRQNREIFPFGAEGASLLTTGHSLGGAQAFGIEWPQSTNVKFWR